MNAEYMKKYRQSENGKAAIRRYETSTKGKTRKKKWEATESGKRVAAHSKKKRMERNRRIIEKAKGVPCRDCGGSFPLRCMDFHHVTGKKLFEVGRRLNKGTGSIVAELAKCVVVCANCHRLRHK